LKPSVNTCIVFRENAGDQVIFQWVEKIKEWISNKSDISFNECTKAENRSCSVQPALSAGDFANDQENEIVEVIEDTTPVIQKDLTESEPEETSNIHIIQGDPMTFKKSTFQGFAAVIRNQKDARYKISLTTKGQTSAHFPPC